VLKLGRNFAAKKTKNPDGWSMIIGPIAREKQA